MFLERRLSGFRILGGFLASLWLTFAVSSVVAAARCPVPPRPIVRATSSSPSSPPIVCHCPHCPGGRRCCMAVPSGPQTILMARCAPGLPDAKTVCVWWPVAPLPATHLRSALTIDTGFTRPLPQRLSSTPPSLCDRPPRSC